MKRMIISLVAVSMIILGLSSFSALAENGSYKIMGVQGKVLVLTPSSPDWFEATVGLELPAGTIVKTDEGAAVNIQGPGELALYVGEKSQVTLGSFGTLKPIPRPYTEAGVETRRDTVSAPEVTQENPAIDNKLSAT